MFADVINTVSPTYAREIMTKENGELLDELLRERKSVVSGILNGIDYSIWNPEEDSFIAVKYSQSKIEDRIKNKAVLQERFGLPVREDAFLVVAVGRLAKQKGFDLLAPVLPHLLDELPMQLIVVGEGDSEIMSFFHDLETKYPIQVATHLRHDSVLPHIVFAGADVIIVPSRFEPCGLTPMEAMRMGTIPIVRKTGGLADQVEDYHPSDHTGTGFLFEKFDSTSFMISFIRAFENFRDKEKWRSLQRRAMGKDFSWERSAKKYVDLFIRAIRSKDVF